MKTQFLITRDHPVIRDHVVRGEHLLPGLAYVDLIYQFLGGLGYSFEEWELRELSIYEPVVVRDRALVLTVEAARSADENLRILVESVEQGSTSKPRRHVAVKACRVEAVSFDESIDFPSIRRSAAAAIDASQIYDHYRDLGLSHGEFMQVGGTVHVADGAVYVELALGAATLETAPDVLFSPALLDGAAVCGSVGLAHAKVLASRRLSLPLYFQSFRACAPLQESCAVRLRFDLVRRGSDVSYLTMEFFGQDGRKVAELRDLGGTSGLENERADAPAVASSTVSAAPSDEWNEQRRASAVAGVEQMLRGWLIERGHSHARDADAATTFAELGLDSTELLQLLLDVEVKLGTPLSPTLLFEYGSVKELAGHLVDAHGGKLAAQAPASGPATATGVAQAAAAAAAAEPARRAAPTGGATDPEAAPAAERDADTPSPFEGVLRTYLGRTLGHPPERLDRNATFSEMGFDSIDLLSLLKDLETHLGVGLSATLLFEYRTIKELAGHLDVLALTTPLRSVAAATEAEHAARHERDTAKPPPAQSTAGREPTSSISAETPAPASGDIASGDIAIIGISGQFPGASSVDALWDVLQSGADCVTEIPLERWDYRQYRYYEEACRWGGIEFCHWGGFIDDVDKFDASFFNVQPLHADCMDPQERLLLQTTWELLETAGYTRERLRREHDGRVGVYVASMYHDYSHIESDISQELGTFMSLHSSLANRVSHFFDLNGPSLAVDTMCSSSAVALHAACKDLKSGDCEAAIVGGVNLSLHHKKFIALSHEKQAGTHSGSRSFAKADGYLPAEAVGAVLLKPLEKAIEAGDPILGVIKSTAVNHSGRSNGYTVPNPTAQAKVIEECIAKAGIDPRTVSYVEATSNGSSLGDPIELVALQRVFAKHAAGRPIGAIGTVKSNIGHAEAASGITQLAKVLLQFEHRQLPPSIKTDPPNPLAEWAGAAFGLVRELEEWTQPTVDVDGSPRSYPRRAILNSFGAGGTNASLLLEEFVEPVPDARRSAGSPPRRAEIFVLSARSPDRLPLMLRELHAHLRRHPELSLADVAYTLQLGREAMKARLALVATSREELLEKLEKSLVFDPEKDRTVPADLPLCFDDGTTRSPVRDLIDGKAGRALIETLVRDNDVQRLAMLWTQGAEIPWQLLHVASGARSVRLPTYPFRKERHWLLPREPGPRVELAPAAAAPQQVAPPASDVEQLERVRGKRVAPRNDLERAVADIWEDVLGVRGIGVTDDFFELGGNSLQASLAIDRCAEAFNVEIDLGMLVGSKPTVAEFVVSIVSKLANEVDELELESALTT